MLFSCSCLFVLLVFSVAVGATGGVMLFVLRRFWGLCKVPAAHRAILGARFRSVLVPPCRGLKLVQIHSIRNEAPGPFLSELRLTHNYMVIQFNGEDERCYVCV